MPLLSFLTAWSLTDWWIFIACSTCEPPREVGHTAAQQINRAMNSLLMFVLRYVHRFILTPPRKTARSFMAHSVDGPPIPSPDTPWDWNNMPPHRLRTPAPYSTPASNRNASVGRSEPKSVWDRLAEKRLGTISIFNRTTKETYTRAA